jgi:hypothetical protein
MNGSTLLALASNTITLGCGGGLRGEYYDSMNFAGAPQIRTDLTIDFNWGTGVPHPSIGQDTFSVRWTGKVQAITSGTYTFCTESDDGIKVWVNDVSGTPIISNWTTHAVTQDCGTINLSAGQIYDIKIEYYDNTNNAVVRLKWTPPSLGEQIVPTSQLFP